MAKSNDARHLTSKEQTIQRVDTLFDILKQANVKSFKDLKGIRLKNNIIQTVAKQHKVTKEKIYRWIREYREHNGIVIQAKGRTVHS